MEKMRERKGIYNGIWEIDGLGVNVKGWDDERVTGFEEL